MLKSILGTIVIGMALMSPIQASVFRDGDRWCAIGDSITHGGTYHYFIDLFYATRFPDRKIELFNCGISGDSAAGTLKRLDWDILAKKPTVASIMLGMNDVGIFDYGPDKNTPEHEAIRQKNIDTYKTNMRTLVEKLNTEGIRIILITPSIYDQTSAIGGPVYFGGNDGLGIFSQYMKELAKKYDTEIVDFHWPMKQVNAEQQKIDPLFALAGADRVHPGDIGHFVMAYLFLRDQGVPRYVSRIDIDAESCNSDNSVNCEVSDIRRTKKSIRFSCIENSLPFPIQESAKQALSLVPFMNDLNQEELRVAGLSDGIYKLKIDDDVIGQYTDDQFAKGINLAEMENTPQYRQAVKVMLANGKRHNISTNPLRNIAITEYMYWPDRSKGKVELDKIMPVLDNIRQDAAKNEWTYFVNLIDSYKKDKPNEEKLYEEMASYTDEMWKLAQPRQHKFVIERQ